MSVDKASSSKRAKGRYCSLSVMLSGAKHLFQSIISTITTFHFSFFYINCILKHIPPEKYFPFSSDACRNRYFHSLQSTAAFTSLPVYSAMARQFLANAGRYVMPPATPFHFRLGVVSRK